MKIKELKSFLNQPGHFKVEEIFPRLYIVKHKNRKQSALTFLRYQEYYESPKFKEKSFTHEEFYDHYKVTHDGIFSYHRDWAGFNFPSSVLHKVNKRMKLTKKEKEIYQFFQNKEDCYIIGVNKNENSHTYRHEIAHGLYSLSPEYRSEVRKALRGIDLTPIKKILKEMGYHRSVFADEVQAYLCFDLTDLVLGLRH